MIFSYQNIVFKCTGNVTHNNTRHRGPNDEYVNDEQHYQSVYNMYQHKLKHLKQNEMPASVSRYQGTRKMTCIFSVIVHVRSEILQT